jgi:hypothetical protein
LSDPIVSAVEDAGETQDVVTLTETLALTGGLVLE